jgi:hypothetical protein
VVVVAEDRGQSLVLLGVEVGVGVGVGAGVRVSVGRPHWYRPPRKVAVEIGTSQGVPRVHVRVHDPLHQYRWIPQLDIPIMFI